MAYKTPLATLTTSQETTRFKEFFRQITNPWDIAASVLGASSITPKEVMDATGIVYDEALMASMERVVPQGGYLTRARDEQMTLYPGPATSLTLVELLREFPWAFTKYRALEATCASVQSVVHPGIYMMPNGPQRGSLGVNHTRIPWILKEGQRIPEAAEVIWCSVLEHLVRGRTLLGSGVYTRTRTVWQHENELPKNCVPETMRLYVGNTDESGMFVGTIPDSIGRRDCGIIPLRGVYL